MCPMKRNCHLLFSVLLAILIATIPGLAGISLTNPSFEEPLIDGVPPGWPSSFGHASFGEPPLRLSDEKAKDGVCSLRIEDLDPEASFGLRSAHIAAEPGREYEASVQVFVQEGAAQLYLEFWDKSGTRIQADFEGVLTLGEWVPITVKRTAPEQAVTLTLLLYAHKTNVGVAYYDMVGLR
jgi:hypothetical protein